MDSEKAQLIRTCFIMTIDMRSTKFARLLTAPLGLPRDPAPPSSVAEIKEMEIPQRGQIHFDITGACSASPVRYGETPYGRRAIVDMEVMDGSTGKGAKMASLKFTLYFAAGAAGKLQKPWMACLRWTLSRNRSASSG